MEFMPTSDSRITFLTDQLGGAGEVRMKKMFGEFGVYLDEVFIGVVCDDQLFLKVTPGGKAMLGEGHLAPAYPGAKPSLKIPEERLEERDWLVELARTTAQGLQKKRA